jgi:hypothetical protein
VQGVQWQGLWAKIGVRPWLEIALVLEIGSGQGLDVMIYFVEWEWLNLPSISICRARGIRTR